MARNGTKQANGSGTIKQRANGTWEGRYTYYDDYGRPQRASVYAKTKTECRKKLTAAMSEVDTTGTHAQYERCTYGEWVRQWLDTYSVNWKPNTRRNYEEKFQKHILPKLGHLQLTHITPIMCQRFINDLASTELSPKSIKNLHSMIHSSLKRAVRMRLIPNNPCDNIELPHVEKPKLKPLMDSDIKKFLDAAKEDPFYDFYVVAIFTGMRISELIGLKWENVDFTARIITVTHQLQRIEESGKYTEILPKNNKNRIVPLSDSVASVLKSVKSRQAEYQLLAGPEWVGEGYVFTNDLGVHYKQPTVQHHFKKVARKAGFENLRFHDLRHTCAILALQVGADIKSVSDMLGHYSTAFTMDVYGDVSNAMRERTRNSLDKAFKDTVG